MKILTALGNETINKKIRENVNDEVFETDIQYQEALLEVIEKNKNINLLILSSLLPGELNIYELINIIKFKNPYLEIIIILEKENNKLVEFLISKDINNIYYNNKITIEEIIKKINNIKNKTKNILLKNNYINNFKEKKYIRKKTINLLKIIKNKINKKLINFFYKIKNNINYSKNNKKIISIIGASKIGKSIFCIILGFNIKNKKILLINMDFNKNDIKTIIGIKNNKKEKIINWKKNIKIMQIDKKEFDNRNLNNRQKVNDFFNEMREKFDYVIIDVGETKNKENIIKNSDENILLVEGNLLGIKETKEILTNLINEHKLSIDKIKIVFNKQTKCSVSKSILHTMFSDFRIITELKYREFYNILINTNFKICSCKIDKEYKKIVKEII